MSEAREPTNWWQEQVRKGGAKMSEVPRMDLVNMLRNVIRENMELRAGMKVLKEAGEDETVEFLEALRKVEK